jgi:hypothetical protein
MNDVRFKTMIGKSIIAYLDSDVQNVKITINGCHFYKLNECDEVFSLVTDGDKVEIFMHKIKILPLSAIHFTEYGAFKRWVLVNVFGGSK